MTRATLILLLAGCGEALPIYVVSSHADAVENPDYVNRLTPEDIEVLDEAFAIVGFPYELVDYKHGSVQIDLVEVEPGQFRGRQSLRTPCRRIFRSERHSVSVAHELGHALIDDEQDTHRDEEQWPDNVMVYEPHDDAEFTDLQLDVMESERRMIVGCVNY